MTSEQSWTSAFEWLSLPDAADALGESVGRVRRLIDDHHLAAVRVDGVLKIPALFLRDGEPLSSLRGTLIVLHDVGLPNDEAVEWMLSHDDTLEIAPIEALRAGRKTEVRRVALTLN